MDNTILANEKFKIIDSHCHLWDLSLGYNGWICDRESELLGSLKPLTKNYLPEDYAYDTHGFNVDKIVHIEASNTRFAKNEVQWVSELAKQFPLIGAIVGGADLLDAHIDELLSFYSVNPLIKGIRQILNWHENSKYTAADRMDDLINSNWRKHYSLLKRYDLSFDMQICPRQMQTACNLAKKFSDITVIIEHAGMPIEEDLNYWKRGIVDLAKCSNIFIKISGFGMFNHQWGQQSIENYVNTVVDAFGVDRCMFASNFPVDKLYSSFASIMETYYTIVQKASLSEKEQLFYSNAKRIYKID